MHHLTPSYRILESGANNNANTFLVMTLLFATAMFADMYLIPGEIKSSFPAMLCFLVVTIVGFATYVVLMVYSKKYLRMIVNSWVNRTVESTISNGRFVAVMKSTSAQGMSEIANRGQRAFAQNTGDDDGGTDDETMRILASNLSAQRSKAASYFQTLLSIAICLVELFTVLLSLTH